MEKFTKIIKITKMQDDTTKTRDWVTTQYGADDAQNFTQFDEDIEEFLVDQGGVKQLLWKSESTLQQDNALYFALIKNIEVERELVAAGAPSYRDPLTLQGDDAETEQQRLQTRKEDAIMIMDKFYAIELSMKAKGIKEAMRELPVVQARIMKERRSLFELLKKRTKGQVLMEIKTLNARSED